MLVKELLLEALKPSQYRKYVRAWDREKYDRAIFPKGEYRIYLPLHKSEENKEIVVPQEIEKVLTINGYTLVDYIGGKAKDKYGRDTTIGKILGRFAPNLKSTFDNDPQRKGSKGDEASLIVISRHPYDIAGMSTDRGWTSCMNLVSGGNKKYVMANVKGGSLIAYLVDKNDLNINRPKARVLINPFINKDNPNEVALGVNSKVYGTASPEFLNTVVKWADSINASKNLEGTYKLSSKVYPETDDNEKWFGKIPTTEKEQLKFLEQRPDSFYLIKNPSRKVQEKAVSLWGSNIKYISNPDEKLQKLAVRDDTSNIKYIENPTPMVQKYVVKDYPEYIEFIKNPTEELQLYCVRNDPESFEYIKNPTESVQKLAVKLYGYNILFIKDPSEELQMLAVNSDPSSIEYIDNPTEKVQLASLRYDFYNINYINNPTEKVQLMVVKSDINYIYNIDEPTPAVQLYAIKINPTIISQISDPTEEVQMIAVKYDPNLLARIKRPTEKVKIQAVTEMPSLLKLIKNPSDEVKQAAKEAKKRLATGKVATKKATSTVSRKSISPPKRKK